MGPVPVSATPLMPLWCALASCRSAALGVCPKTISFDADDLLLE
jgi:hypothetical protein